MRRVFKNKELFKVSGDQKVTVSVTFSANPSSRDETIMKNAAEALKFFADNGYHKSWEEAITIEKKSI